MKRIKPLMFIITLLAAAVLTAIAGNRAGWFTLGQPVAQPDAREEYQQLCARYLQQDSLLSLAGNIQLFDGENRKQVKEQSSFELIRQGNNGLYSRLSHVQTFGSGQWVVQLDTLNRMMIVGEAIKSPDAQGAMPQQSVDLLFSDTAAFKITGQVTGNDQERTLSFKSDFNPEIRQYRITYNAQTYQLKRAVIEWWKDALVLDSTKTDRVWITHIDYRYRPVAKVNVDDMISRIVSIHDGKVIPAEKYKDYEVHIASNQEQ